jgi:hypothetical protein
VKFLQTTQQATEPCRFGHTQDDYDPASDYRCPPDGCIV